MSTEVALASGLVERIGIEGSAISHRPAGMDKVVIETPMPSHKEAMDNVMKALLDANHGVIKSLDDIDAIGHRAVHGGEAFASSVVANDEVIAKLEECVKLAPLHNPANLIGLNVCKEIFPKTPMVCVFDTAFHQTMPEEAYIYALPYEFYDKYEIRKFGFHGTSHNYVAQEAAKLMGEELGNLKLISCHLGNGASICAIRHGKSIETSMGMTPLAGVVMGTRCGDIDPSLVPYLVEQGYTVEEVDNIMNKKSGVLGISGVSSDFRDIEAAAEDGNKRAQLALDIFHYKVRCTIGAYVAAMDGVDGIIFTAGVGENSPETRYEVCKNLKYLGIQLDEEANSKRGKASIITTEGSVTKVMVIPTNEELMIARDTLALVQK